MSKLSVSVVIPAYKASKTICRAVNSVLGQSRSASEILIIDDGSPDGAELASTLSKYGDRVTLIHKPNGGAASARNMGIDLARGEAIAFLDADDFWQPGKLDYQLGILELHPEIGLTSSRWYEIEPSNPPILSPIVTGIVYDRPWRPCGAELVRATCHVLTSTVIVRKSSLGTQRFCRGLEPAEDRDLWIRLLATAPIYICSTPFLTYMAESGSLSRTNLDRDCQNMLRVIHRNADLLGSTPIRLWEIITYRRWAGEYLSVGQPRSALRPAIQRLRRQPFSMEGWYILGHCLARCCLQ